MRRIKNVLNKSPCSWAFVQYGMREWLYCLKLLVGRRNFGFILLDIYRTLRLIQDRVTCGRPAIGVGAKGTNELIDGFFCQWLEVFHVEVTFPFFLNFSNNTVESVVVRPRNVYSNMLVKSKKYEIKWMNNRIITRISFLIVFACTSFKVKWSCAG